MSEEIKEILEKPNVYSFADECYLYFGDYNKLKHYITNLQQKVEQLENIRKEAIEYINNHQLVFELSSKKQIQYWFDEFYKNILNILNKGSDEND